jgi:hypothetical protein
MLSQKKGGQILIQVPSKLCRLDGDNDEWKGNGV